jgi:hypothetical protein
VRVLSNTNRYRTSGFFTLPSTASSTNPTRSALLLNPSPSEDGLLQGWEILLPPASRTGHPVCLAIPEPASSTVKGRLSLVRPFLAAGARTVVANLWAADDQFSLALMRLLPAAAGDDSWRSWRQLRMMSCSERKQFRTMERSARVRRRASVVVSRPHRQGDRWKPSLKDNGRPSSTRSGGRAAEIIGPAGT